MIFISNVVLNQNKSFINESQQTVIGLQKIEATINNDENNLEIKKILLYEKQQELEKAIIEGKDFQKRVKTEAAKLKSVTITEENVADFVKPTSELYNLWLKQEVKRKSRDNCMQIIRKLYEDKKITLAIFLNQIDKLASKEFTNIYKKAKFEGLIRREEKAKA
jgi:predicted ribonuclease YlaK